MAGRLVCGAVGVADVLLAIAVLLLLAGICGRLVLVVVVVLVEARVGTSWFCIGACCGEAEAVDAVGGCLRGTGAGREAVGT